MGRDATPGSESLTRNARNERQGSGITASPPGSGKLTAYYGVYCCVLVVVTDVGSGDGATGTYCCVLVRSVVVLITDGGGEEHPLSRVATPSSPLPNHRRGPATILHGDLASFMANMANFPFLGGPGARRLPPGPNCVTASRWWWFSLSS